MPNFEFHGLGGLKVGNVGNPWSLCAEINFCRFNKLRKIKDWRRIIDKIFIILPKKKCLK